MSPLRLAFGRISQETNSLSPVLSTLDDFERAHWLEGPDLLSACGPRQHEVPGFARDLELSGFAQAVRAWRDQVELVPLLSAWAIPGGPLSRETFEELCHRLRASVAAAGPLDGIFFSMHGALGAQGSDDPEADFLEILHAAGAPVVVSLDLHAHITPRLMALATAVVAYRTNPHRDHARVGRRAGEILLRTVTGASRPTMAWRSLPMVLGGGTTIDFAPTMRPLFRRLKRLERDPRVLYASLFICHIWNRSPDLGWAPVVVTDDAPELAEALAEELAEACWSVRHIQPPTFPTAEEALAQARRAWLARRLGTVCICDASDIVGAGAAGESTGLLRVLLEQGRGMRSLAPIRDTACVDRLWSNRVGDRVSAAVGGRLDPAHSSPLAVTGRLRSRHETGAMGRAVVLDLDHLQLVVTEQAPLAMKPAFYADVGLSPWRADVVVVKSMFPFRLYFLAHNRKTIYARTRGLTDLDAALRQTYNDPVHPQSPVEDWRPADRRRRSTS